MEMSSHMPIASELRIVLLGKSEAKTSLVGNVILGREAFETGLHCSSVTQHCERARGAVAERRVAIINTPDLMDTKLGLQTLTQEVECCFFLSSPGPHVLLVVVQPDSFTDEDLERAKRILACWGGTALNHTMVLITPGDVERPTCRENGAVHLLVKACNGREHSFSIRVKTEKDEMIQLVKKMEMLVLENGGCHLSSEMCRDMRPAVTWEDESSKQDIVLLERQRTRQQGRVESGAPILCVQPEEISGSSCAMDGMQIILTHVPVVCGDKNGTLCPDRLARGQQCIQAGRRWFYPQEFEVLGGKKSYKNWKKSIRYGDTTLHRLIQDGRLKCENLSRWRRETRQRDQDGLQCSSCSLQKDKQQQARPKGGRKQFPSCRSRSLPTDFREKAEARRMRDNGDHGEAVENHREVDMSAFAGDSLSVTCGSARGTLQKGRFANGTSGKCIRTEERWLTPVDFTKEDPTLTDPHWKKSILCLEFPLKFLIEKKVLELHSLLCECNLCSTNEKDLSCCVVHEVQLDQENDDKCFICNDERDLLCCDYCPRAFHKECHIPAVDTDILGDKWMCTYCMLKTSQQSQMPLDAIQQSPISDHMLQCQYLLLFLYKEDQEVCHAMRGQENVHERPTWLDEVVEKLQSKCYSTVDQFFSDILHIFDNYTSSNRENEFGEAGAKRRDFFKKAFEEVFSM